METKYPEFRGGNGAREWSRFKKLFKRFMMRGQVSMGKVVIPQMQVNMLELCMADNSTAASKCQGAIRSSRGSSSGEGIHRYLCCYDGTT
jgi:hypothetical protein